MTDVSRRSFVRQSSGALAGVTLASCATGTLIATSPTAARANDMLHIAGIGCGGMGTNDIKKFLLTKRVKVVGLCDVDEKFAGKCAEIVEEATDVAPKIYDDYRKVLEDKDVDAVLVATPDHWHAPITIAACEAGKDVYVEKPCAHTVYECRQMAAAADKYKRMVQHGTQQRSGAHFQEAREYVRSGKLGTIGLVRTWALPVRKKLEVVPNSDPPATLDYDFWQGPAPVRDYNKNLSHPYNWRFAWDYGTGDMGNWGVHWLDIALWTLDLGWPKSTSSSGGKFVFKDAKETPDTQVSLYDYDDLTLIWEQRLWSGKFFEGRQYGTAFYGENETLVVNREGMWVYDKEGQQIYEAQDVTSIDELSIRHMNNFIDSCQTREQPIANIASGSVSAGISLLGNVAYLAEARIPYDAEKHTTGSAEYDKLLTKEYRSKYPLPKV